MANDKFIKEIADKLNGFSSEVNPQMWQAVSSQVGAGAAAGNGLATGVGKVAVIVVGVTAVSVASYFGFKSDDKEPNPTINKVVQTLSESSNKENQTPVSQKEQVSEPQNEKKTTVKATTKSTKQPAGLTKGEASTSETETIEVKTPSFVGVITIEKPNNPTVKTEVTPSSGTNKTNASESTTKTDNQGENTSSSYPIKTNYNVFTPNGDGTNDYFYVESEGLTDYSIVIMDEKNNKVWESKDPEAQWDGRNMMGQMVSEGRYLCLIAGNGPDRKPFGKHVIITIRK